MKKLIIILAACCLILILVALTIAASNQQQVSQLKISYLDVGQGDASLITTTLNEHILIDCGPDQEILSALNRHLNWQNHSLDMIIISHDHADHWGGLIHLINKYQIKKIVLAKPQNLSEELSAILKTAQQQGIDIIDIRAPSIIKLTDGSQLIILWPNEQQLLDYKNNINNQSLVVLWRYGQTSFLWTGDLEADAEQELLSKQESIQVIDILKIAHHGSWTASSLDWLNYWQPKIAIISLATNNQFGLPSQLIIDRLKQLNIRLWRTDQLGDFNIFSNGRMVWR